MQTIEFSPSRIRKIIATIGGIFVITIFTVLAVAAWFGSASSSIGMTAIALFFDLLVIWSLVKTWSKSKSGSGGRLVLDDEGVLDQTMSTSKIPWHVIEAAKITETRKYGMVLESFIRLRLRDEQERLQQLTPNRRKLASINQAMGAGSFFLNVTALPVSAEEVLRLMNERRAQLHLPVLIDGIDTGRPAESR